MIDLSKEKLELDYPCNWIYKVIGYDEKEIKLAVKEVVCREEYNIKLSNKSKKGTFLSFTLEVLVHSEDDRKELYDLLRNHEKIKTVL